MHSAASDVKFEAALKIFERQVGEATQFWFAAAAINEIARRSKATFHALGQNPLFWNTVRGALQNQSLMALGRIFGTGRHNLDTLMTIVRNERKAVFSATALEARKRRLTPAADEWLPTFMKTAHSPTARDIERLDRLIDARRAVYRSQYRDIRDKEIAHTVISGQTALAGLYAKTRIRDLERLIVFLNQLYDTLWHMYFNGTKPRLRRARFSTRSLTRRPIIQLRSNATHEQIIADTRRSLRMLARGHAAQQAHDKVLRGVRWLHYR